MALSRIAFGGGGGGAAPVTARAAVKWHITANISRTAEKVDALDSPNRFLAEANSISVRSQTVEAGLSLDTHAEANVDHLWNVTEC